MNPFDLLINEHPIQSSLTPLEFYKEISSPSLPNPTSNTPVGFSSNKKPVDLQSLFDSNKQDQGFWTEQSNTNRYGKPGYEYEPRANMEKIYADNQSSTEAWGAQLLRAWDMGKSFYQSSYIGTGRAVKSALKNNWDSYSSFNQLEQITENLQRDLREHTDPIYRSGEEAWYSPKGFLGDLTPSLVGFTGAAVVTGIQDAIVGKGLSKGIAAGVAAGPVGWALLGAGAAGVASLFSDKAEETLGDNTTNYLIGAIVGGGTAGFLNKAFSSIKLGRTAATEAKVILEATKKAPEFRQLLDASLSANVGKAIKSFTSEIALSNIKNRLPQLGVSLAKNYMYAGAESGMEAMDAQIDYLKSFYDEKEKSGQFVSDDEKLKLQTDVASMGKDVYKLNKVINTLFNFSMMGDIISGAAYRAGVKDLGLIYKEGIFAADKSLAKQFLKSEALHTALEEGSQEFLQLVISEGSKNSLKNRAKQDYATSYLESAKHLLTSKEGIQEFLAGAISGVGIHQSSALFRGANEAANGGSFKEGYTGINETYRDTIIKALNEQKGKIDKIAKSSKSNINDSNLDEAIWDMFYYATRVDQHGLFKSFINDAFTKDESLKQMFAKDTPEATQANIEKTKNDILRKADRVRKNYDNFVEYFSNPYTTGLINSKDKDVKEKARIFDDLVSESARLLYLKQNNIEEAVTFRKDLDNHLAGTPIYEFFKDNSIFDFSSDGVSRFKKAVADERFIMDSLNEKDPIREKRLSLLEDSVNRFVEEDTNKVPGLEKLYNPMVDYLLHMYNISNGHLAAFTYLKNKKVFKGNPNIIANKLGISVKEYNEVKDLFKNGNPIPASVSGLDILNSLYNLKRVNTTLTVVTNDLENLTDRDKQATYIDYIHSLRQQVKTEVVEDAKNINNQKDSELREKLVGVDSDSQKLYQALDSLGIIDIREISCD